MANAIICTSSYTHRCNLNWLLLMSRSHFCTVSNNVYDSQLKVKFHRVRRLFSVRSEKNVRIASPVTTSPLSRYWPCIRVLAVCLDQSASERSLVHVCLLSIYQQSAEISFRRATSHPTRLRVWCAPIFLRIGSLAVDLNSCVDTHKEGRQVCRKLIVTVDQIHALHMAHAVVVKKCSCGTFQLGRLILTLPPGTLLVVSQSVLRLQKKQYFLCPVHPAKVGSNITELSFRLLACLFKRQQK